MHPEPGSGNGVPVDGQTEPSHVQPSESADSLASQRAGCDQEPSEPLHKRLQHHRRRHWLKYFIFTIIHSLVTFAVAYALREFRPHWLPQAQGSELDPEVGRQVFAYGMFDEKEAWGEDLPICALSFCCMSIIWANTLASSKVRILGSFWMALWISLLHFHEFNTLTFGAAHLVFVCIAVYCRQKIREKFGLEARSPATYAQDCLVWFLFPCCAAAQEARQVEHVKPLRASLVPSGASLRLEGSDAG